MGKGPLDSVVRPLLSLPAPSPSTFNCTFEDGLRLTTDSCHVTIQSQFSFLNNNNNNDNRIQKKEQLEIFDKLLTAPRTVSNT